MANDDLYAALTSTKSASRPLVVSYLQKAAKEVAELPATELAKRSGGSQFREAQTQGEILASHIFHALVMQDVVDDDEELYEVCNIVQELTSQADNAVLWAEFIDKVNQLRNK